MGVVDEAAIGEKFRALAGELNERQRRLWAASEARAAGRGGVAATARATGLAVDTIRKGIAELESGERLAAGRVRRPGGGRKPLTELDPMLLEDLERLVDADSRGDPQSVLRWTSKSVRNLAAGLRERGHEVHFTKVAQLLRGLGYSLQANVKHVGAIQLSGQAFVGTKKTTVLLSAGRWTISAPGGRPHTLTVS